MTPPRERSGRPDDAAAIASLVRRTSGPALLSPDGAGAEPYFASVSEAAERGYLADPRYRFRVLVDESDHLVAFGATRDRTHLFHLFVEPGWQGRGLARVLWRSLLAETRAGGGPGAMTVNSTLPAIPVYTRFGFLPVGDVMRVHGIAFQPMRLEPPVDGE